MTSWARLDALRMGRLGLFLFYGYLIAVIVGGITLGGIILENEDAIHAAHRALCEIKASDERRLNTAVQFLIDHPEGTPEFPRGVIIRSINVARFDVAGLADVSCPTPKETP